MGMSADAYLFYGWDLKGSEGDWPEWLGEFADEIEEADWDYKDMHEKYGNDFEIGTYGYSDGFTSYVLHAPGSEYRVWYCGAKVIDTTTFDFEGWNATLNRAVKRIGIEPTLPPGLILAASYG